MKSECIECGDNFNPKRFKLGYRTCIECGEEIAQIEMVRNRDASPLLITRALICMLQAHRWRRIWDVEEW